MSRADDYAASRAFAGVAARHDARPRSPSEAALRNTRTLLLKPVGDKCNLACPYCYEMTRRPGGMSAGRMSPVTLESVFANLLPHVPKPFDIFVHGGEPLLAGRDYFEALVAAARRHAGSGEIRWGVQTNGVLIDEAFAEFFAAHAFNVGVSLDGPPAIHDAQRPQHNGTGSHARAVAGIERLKRADVAFGITAVITRRLAETEGGAALLLDHFAGLGATQFDVHPAWTPFGDARDENLDPAAYARFILELFDSWTARGDPAIRIRSFEEFFKGMTGASGETCFRAGRCLSILGVDPDGSASPCTRPFGAEHRFGNLAARGFDEIVGGEGYRRFAADEAAGRAAHAACKWANLCGSGGCPHERLRDGAQAVDGRHVYCTCDETGNVGGYPAIFAGLIRRVEYVLGSRVKLQ
ncbi:MAG: radical SAM protein [Rhizomicrobium sp.]